MPGPEGSIMLVAGGPAPPVTPAHLLLLLVADLSEPSSEYLTDPGAEGGAEAGAAADVEAGAAADDEAAAAAGCLGASTNAGLAGGTVIAREPMPFGDLAAAK